MTTPSLENATDENCQLAIDQMLREGNVAAAYHIFLATANNIKSPPKKETLVALLKKIDEASSAQTSSSPKTKTVVSSKITETDLVHNASIKLENALGYFLEVRTGPETFELTPEAACLLRLYKRYGEPAPRSETAREIGFPRPNLCLVHIPHPTHSI